MFNNYFQDLEGTGYRAAVAVVNGVPNSPLNRYFQVKDADIVFNTFVNVEEAIVIGAGQSSEQSLPPDGLSIVSNLVSTRNGPIIELEDTPTNVRYESNIFYGADAGIPAGSGFVAVDPELEQASGLWQLAAGSPPIDAGSAVAYVTDDLHGQPRDSAPDIGADEWAQSPVLYGPLDRQDVGPNFSDQILQSRISITPAVVSTLDAYPNPFTSMVTFGFELVQPGPVQITIYDMLGRELTRLREHAIAGGSKVKVWLTSTTKRRRFFPRRTCR